ncbi:MAG: hypothetical protein WCO11_11950 [Sphingomonadales bacterium]|jgi:hypothetical protein
MDANPLPLINLALSGLAVLVAVGVLLRVGRLADKLTIPPAVGPARVEVPPPELVRRLMDLDEQADIIIRKLDKLENRFADMAMPPPVPPGQGLPATVAAAQAPALAPSSVQIKQADAVQPVVVAPVSVNPRIDTVPTPATTAASPELASTAPSPAAAAPAGTSDEDLIDGYRNKIAERRKGPIREWLAQHNSVALDPQDDGSLLPTDAGPLAGIRTGHASLLLFPTAGFVVDFATRFAGSPISMRQVMRTSFDLVVDNSGDMKLQAPAIARLEGERWVLERPGRLSGFIDG